MSNIRNLTELSMPTELAKEVVSQIAAGTSQNADIQALTTLAGGAVLADVVTKVNAIITALKG